MVAGMPACGASDVDACLIGIDVVIVIVIGWSVVPTCMAAIAKAAMTIMTVVSDR